MIADEMYALAKRLWPINRSLTGDGVRQTLKILQCQLPELTMHEVPTHTKVFDWTVPREWRVRDAWIKTPRGERICEFQKNNLHLMGYSVPVRATLDWATLNEHLYSLPDQPTAIPYVTSYYQERWGFCLSHEQRNGLDRKGKYEVYIDAELFDGHLTYGDLIIPGRSSQEVLLSTYVCHPSMANNELSGPIVATFLARWLAATPNRRYTYRFVFIPETIGSIVYLSRHLDSLKSSVIAGFNISCVGDDRSYSYLPSRSGNTLSDRVALHVLKWIDPNFRRFSWLDRGSDERQYCAPGVDLPIASIMRTKYAEYPEYHTSLDSLERVVTPKGLFGGYEALRRALEAIEANVCAKVTVLGEPQLGKRGLYPTISTKETARNVRTMMNFLTYADGINSLLDIAELGNVPIWDLYEYVETFEKNGLITIESSNS